MSASDASSRPAAILRAFSITRSMVLTGRLDAEADHQRVVARKEQRSALGRHAARMLEHAGKADAAQPAALPGLLAPGRERDVAAELQRLFEYCRKLAAVIGGADRGLVWHGGGRNQIAAADLDRIEPDQPRRLLDSALQHIVRFGANGTAIGSGRHRVGEDAA